MGNLVLAFLGYQSNSLHSDQVALWMRHGHFGITARVSYHYHGWDSCIRLGVAFAKTLTQGGTGHPDSKETQATLRLVWIGNLDLDLNPWSVQRINGKPPLSSSQLEGS